MGGQPERTRAGPRLPGVTVLEGARRSGFRPVGIMRRYQRDPDGTWHDGLLMDLLADEFIEQP